MQGLPGSGKTTIAREMQRVLPKGSVVRISRDDIRTMLMENYYSSPCETLVSDIEEKAVIAALMSGKSVIVDACHLKKKYISKWDNVIRYVHMKQPEISVDITIIPIATSLQKCIDRDAKRPEPVGEDIIENMYLSTDVDIVFDK